MHPRITALQGEFDRIRSTVTTIEQTAVAEGRDLTDTEDAEVSTLCTRAEQIQGELEPLLARQRSMDATAEILARVGASRTPARTRAQNASEGVPSIGEYLSLLWRSHQGDAEASEMLTRTIATQVLSGNTGIVPTPIVGGLIKFADSRRPVFGSLTSRPMPSSGKTFTRPRITQRVNVGLQSAELDELTSRSMVITGEEVTKKTYAGALELSEQDLDWTDPAILQLAIEDFGQMYAEVTEAAACTALTALASTTGSWTATDIGTIVASITAGIQTVYSAAKRMPDTVWLSLDEMLSLAGTTNTDDSMTAMTLIRQALSDAGVPMRFVTGPQLSNDTRIIGCSDLVESYEVQKGLLSAQNITHLGLDIAYRGYVSFYGRREGFVKLT